MAVLEKLKPENGQLHPSDADQLGMMNYKTRSHFQALSRVVFASALLVGSLFGCGGPDQYSFSPSKLAQTEPLTEPTGQPTPPPDCTVSTTQKKLRIFVMVDNSGSTADTDPNQEYRVDTLQKFLSQYGSKANLTYGFGYFADDASLYDMNREAFTLNSSSAPFGSAIQIARALQSYHASVPPLGGTGYGVAFKALGDAITRDESTGVTQDYVVVFMSDGQPTDLSGDIRKHLVALVDKLKRTTQANGKSRLVLSTVYFGDKKDSTSIQNLQTLATEGQGQFVDTNHLSSGGLTIDDLITVPGC